MSPSRLASFPEDLAEALLGRRSISSTPLIVDCRPDPEPSRIFPSIRSNKITHRIQGLSRLLYWCPSQSEADAAGEARHCEDLVAEKFRKSSIRKDAVSRLNSFFFQSGRGKSSHVTSISRNGGVIYEPFRGAGKDVSQGETYFDVTFFTDRPSPINLDGFYAFRCVKLPAADRIWKDYSSATISTGVCLFSQPLLDTLERTESGEIQQVLDDLASAPLTPYETEAIERLSRAVAIMASVISAGLPPSTASPMKIKLDVPTVQYYDLAYQKLSQSEWPVGYAAQWSRIVRGRAALVGDLMSESVDNNLSHFGLDDAPISIDVGNGLTGIASLYENALETATAPNVREFCRALSSGSQGIWKRMFEAMGDANLPDSTKSLAMLSYSEQLLSTMPDGRGLSKRHLILAVDSAAERATIHAADKILRTLKNHGDPGPRWTSLIAVFPLETIIASSGPNMSLYTSDLGNVVSLMV